ncbi:SRPBCC family protein [Paraburkholderia sp. MMS20-SJTN17]|uniref:SRPBCC family protein n=1 Tax=Paraburkholderia translucens TaxID=2886945 RepID=A0ABS8K9I7_9BURK|nr:SRPBCC family protein [Paraburkholderia sp. MMS20-SJTN17]MCC8401411.1 SRPBCC family protein [Paraburkholderia sp. MMS20-SJTN17]
MKNIISSAAARFVARASVLTSIAVVAVALLAAEEAHAGTTVDIDLAAPVVSRHDVDIDAPLSTVWAVQTNISAWPTWRPTVTAAHFDGTLSAGSAFKWEEGGLKITSTVREIVPQRRIVWTGPAQGIFAVHVWEFSATGRGVHVHTEESWSGDVVRANATTLQPMLDGALGDWLTRLKQVSEADSPQRQQKTQ